MDNKQIFSFLAEKLNCEQKTVLVTVVAVSGSSMRGVGAHMGVGDDGSFVGSLSGGCIENAVIAEALEALRSGFPRITRFGAGSRYIDIKLPCGGGLDIHFSPLSATLPVSDCLQAISERQAFSLRLSLEKPAVEYVAHWQSVQYDECHNRVVIGHWPSPKLLIIGHGASVKSLTKLASSMNLEVEVLTPDSRLLSDLQRGGALARHLATPKETGLIQSDSWTAIAFLFHDHDWEIELMAQALKQPNFYVGAMGSHTAHTLRTQALRETSASLDKIAAMRAPIGLFHSSRDPDTLALSALGEIIQAYHQQDFAQKSG